MLVCVRACVRLCERGREGEILRKGNSYIPHSFQRGRRAKYEPDISIKARNDQEQNGEVPQVCVVGSQPPFQKEERKERIVRSETGLGTVQQCGEGVNKSLKQRSFDLIQPTRRMRRCFDSIFCALQEVKIALLKYLPVYQFIQVHYRLDNPDLIRK